MTVHKIAQEILKAHCWKLSGELLICNRSCSYTLLLAAPETTYWTRRTFRLTPHNHYVPMIHLDTQEPVHCWSREMTWHTRLGLQPTCLLQPTSLPCSPKC